MCHQEDTGSPLLASLPAAGLAPRTATLGSFPRNKSTFVNPSCAQTFPWLSSALRTNPKLPLGPVGTLVFMPADLSHLGWLSSIPRYLLMPYFLSSGVRGAFAFGPVASRNHRAKPDSPGLLLRFHLQASFLTLPQGLGSIPGPGKILPHPWQ